MSYHANMPAGSELELLRYVVLALERQGSRQLNSMLNELELTASQAEVLRVIETFGPMSVKEVGEVLVCESGSPSRLVAALVSGGIVRREVNPEDRRETLLSLTPAGRLLAAEVRRVEAAYVQSLSADVDAGEIAQATRVLAKLVTDERLHHALERRFSNTWTA